MKLAILLIRRNVTVGHTVIEPAHSYYSVYSNYAIIWPSDFILNLGKNFTFSGALSVQVQLHNFGRNERST